MRVLLAVLAVLCCPGAPAQRLYNRQLDAAAQQALQAVEKLDSKQLFDRQLKNLSELSKHDFDTAFSGIRRRARDRIQQWTTWCHVNIEMARIAIAIEYPGATSPSYRDLYARRLNAANDEETQARVCGDLIRELGGPESSEPAEAAAWKQRIEQLESQTTTLQEQVDELQKQAPPGENKIAAILDKLPNLTGAADALEGLRDSPWAGRLGSLLDPAAITLQVLGRLSEAHAEFKKNAEHIAAVRQELRELQAEMLKIAVERLAVEVEHLNRLLEIESRRVKDLEDAASALYRYRNAVVCASRRHPGLELMEIDASLRELGETAAKSPVGGFELLHREAVELAALGQPGDDPLARCGDYPLRWTLQQASRALFDAAAVEARAETPGYVSALRRAQEEQRYSLVRSALEARSYETLVRTGIHRLALLHAGGIRPEQLAQLVFQAGQLAGIGIIAAK